MHNIFCALQMVVIFSSYMVIGRVIIPAPRQQRLSLAEPMPSYYYTNINGVPGTYSFGYDVLDPATGNTQFRNEERYPNGTVIGSYGYLDTFGKPVSYRYIADEKGYRVARVKPKQITYHYPDQNTEDSVTWSRRRVQSKNKLRQQDYDNTVQGNKHYYHAETLPRYNSRQTPLYNYY